MICLACNNTIKYPSDLLKCTSCQGMYHYLCLNMTTAFYQRNQHELVDSWACHDCSIVDRKRRGDDTPVRSGQLGTNRKGDGNEDLEDVDNGIAEKSTIFSATCFDSNPPKIATQKSPTLLSQVLDATMQQLDSKLRLLQTHISSDFKTELNKAINSLKEDFTRTTDFLGAQIKDVMDGYCSVTKRLSKLEEENTNLRSELSLLKSNPIEAPLLETINQLQRDLDEREQLSLLNDVDISGVPMFEGESVTHIVMSVATKLGVSLEERDIVSAGRVGIIRKQDGSKDHVRPLPISVKLARRSLKDNLLKNARVRRGATTADLGLPNHEPQSIYINERLTKKNRILFGKTREAARVADWKFAWTKEGRILVRRTSSSVSPVLQIRSKQDIERIFGKSTVGNVK